MRVVAQKYHSANAHSTSEGGRARLWFYRLTWTTLPTDGVFGTKSVSRGSVLGRLVPCALCCTGVTNPSPSAIASLEVYICSVLQDTLDQVFTDAQLVRCYFNNKVVCKSLEIIL